MVMKIRRHRYSRRHKLVLEEQRPSKQWTFVKRITTMEEGVDTVTEMLSEGKTVRLYHNYTGRVYNV